MGGKLRKFPDINLINSNYSDSEHIIDLEKRCTIVVCRFSDVSKRSIHKPIKEVALKFNCKNINISREKF